MFIRNERNIKEFAQYYPIVTSLIAINLFLWLVIFLQLPPALEFRRWGIGFNYGISLGEYWRLVTPIFLHGDLMHVLFNSFSLVLFGPALEQMIGKFRFISAYLATGILANIITFIVEPLGYVHLGASGAIFGLFGIYAFMVAFRKHLIDQNSSQIITIILVLGIIMTFFRPGINVSAHLGGFAAGFAIAPLILAKVRSYSPWRRRTVYVDEDEIQFDPNRWNKKKRIPSSIRKNILWIIIGALALLGLLTRF